MWVVCRCTVASYIIEVLLVSALHFVANCKPVYLAFQKWYIIIINLVQKKRMMVTLVNRKYLLLMKLKKFLMNIQMVRYLRYLSNGSQSFLLCYVSCVQLLATCCLLLNKSILRRCKSLRPPKIMIKQRPRIM